MTIKELKIKEKFYFDTYKNKKSNLDKINHLREMANVIEKLNNLENEQIKSTQIKRKKIR